MKALITGGCGFIGSNTALRLSQEGWEVTLFDNLSRRGADTNLEWLRSQFPVRFVQADVRDADAVESAVSSGGFDVVIHLSGQVAVTTSVLQPRLDFEVNALGTFNVLEALRTRSPQTILINASTNKVYGDLAITSLAETELRYDWPGAVAESQPLDFHSPYGCSKGVADQYVTDYARVYGLRSTSIRQSCIYGPRQFGIEDQGWVAWFAIAQSLRLPITIFGTGKQVRDVLHVDDLIRCYQRAIDRIDVAAGQSFNVGGGADNTLSLLELIQMLEELSGKRVNFDFGPIRPGDQPVYISNTSKAQELLGWSPSIPVRDGVAELWDWIQNHGQLFARPDRNACNHALGVEQNEATPHRHCHPLP